MIPGPPFWHFVVKLKMKIFLIRHTRVAVKPGICYGQSDVDVTESFLDEADKIKHQTATIHFDKIFSSPLLRCKKLSEYLFDSEITYDNRLKEMNFGDWELQKWDNLRNPGVDEWMNDFVHTPCPNGESFIEMYYRVKSFMDDMKKSGSNHVAIVTHGGTIRCILAYLKNENLFDAFKREIKFGELIKTYWK